MRPTKDQYYLNLAKEVSSRATCLRRKYGAVIVKDDTVIATGYNGSPRGERNCCDKGSCIRQEQKIPAGERYELCLHGDTKIKLLNGTSISIAELEKTQEKIWAYGIDPNTFQIIPVLGENIRITGYVKQLIEINFHKSGKVLCTPDHQIMLRDGTYKQAKDLQYNDRVMPIYYNQSKNAGLREHIANGIKCRLEGRWGKPTYTCTSDWAANVIYKHFNPNCIINENNFIHHKDHNPLNNNPDNLELISRAEHSKLHGNFQKLTLSQRQDSAKKMHKTIKKNRGNTEYDKNFRQHARELMQANWANPSFVEGHKKRSKESIKKLHATSNCNIDDIKKRNQGKIIKGIYELSVKSGQTITLNNYEELKKQFKIASRLGEKGNRPPLMKTILKYFSSLEEVISIVEKINHKVESIKTIEYQNAIPVYCMTVPRIENFAIDLGDNSCIISHNCLSLHAEQNACLEAGRKATIGAKLFLYGQDAKTGEAVEGKPCAMCMRVLKNAGIRKYITLTKEGKIKDNPLHFEKWVTSSRFMGKLDSIS